MIPLSLVTGKVTWVPGSVTGAGTVDEPATRRIVRRPQVRSTSAPCGSATAGNEPTAMIVDVRFAWLLPGAVGHTRTEAETGIVWALGADGAVGLAAAPKAVAPAASTRTPTSMRAAGCRAQSHRRHLRHARGRLRVERLGWQVVVKVISAASGR